MFFGIIFSVSFPLVEKIASDDKKDHKVCLFVCLVRVELMDYLDSIDCSLEDFQAMLYGKQFGIDFDALEVKLYHIIIKTSKTQKLLLSVPYKPQFIITLKSSN